MTVFVLILSPLCILYLSTDFNKETLVAKQVGPSTFFSSKQFEVFDVELVSIQDCKRRTIGFYSDFVATVFSIMFSLILHLWNIVRVFFNLQPSSKNCRFATFRKCIYLILNFELQSFIRNLFGPSFNLNSR